MTARQVQTKESKTSHRQICQRVESDGFRREKVKTHGASFKRIKSDLRGYFRGWILRKFKQLFLHITHSKPVGYV